MRSAYGGARFGGAAKKTVARGLASRRYQDTGSPSLVSFILGLMCASPSYTRGRSPVPGSGSLGSVRGAFGKGRPYRDWFNQTLQPRRGRMHWHGSLDRNGQSGMLGATPI
jgi:hypothetical protein